MFREKTSGCALFPAGHIAITGSLSLFKPIPIRCELLA
jgi:hypothetical protein